nr:macro domain-containing protein [uncultured Schaedlerella sp.]
MCKYLKICSAWALSTITIIFTFIPEKCFSQYKLPINVSEEVHIILNRILTYIIVFVISAVLYQWYLQTRKKVTIKGKNYRIQIEYGDLLQKHDYKKVISFDECFTTIVGPAPSDVNADSICGQFLQSHPISTQEMQLLIDKAHLKPMRSKSKFQSKTRYESGKLVPYNDFLLMSFAKLNENGRGEMNHDDFIECLSLLWKEIDTHYGQKNVCISILGSGVTYMGDESLSQQKLLDIIIASYKLSAHKIKLPYQLFIICKESDDFSLNKIGESI